MNHKPDRGARPDRDRWLNLQILRDELIPSPRHVLLGRLADCLDEIAFAGERQVRADAKHGRQDDALEQRPGMEIHLVCETRVARRICGRHVVEVKRPPVASVDDEDGLLISKYRSRRRYKGACGGRLKEDAWRLSYYEPHPVN